MLNPVDLITGAALCLSGELRRGRRSELVHCECKLQPPVLRNAVAQDLMIIAESSPLLDPKTSNP